MINLCFFVMIYSSVSVLLPSFLVSNRRLRLGTEAGGLDIKLWFYMRLRKFSKLAGKSKY